MAFLFLIIIFMKSLLTHITGYALLSPEATTAIENSFEKISLSKNTFLLQEGQVCKQLYFVEKGALRGCYNDDGKEVTHWFAFENDFVTSFHSFTTGKAAVENIQLLEGCILWSISKEALINLLGRFHELERLLRIAYEKYYIRLEERFVNAQFKTAKERYEELLQQSPHILERVPLGCVASYLGISQETLSRIRGRI